MKDSHEHEFDLDLSNTGTRWVKWISSAYPSLGGSHRIERSTESTETAGLQNVRSKICRSEDSVSDWDGNGPVLLHTPFVGTREPPQNCVSKQFACDIYRTNSSAISIWTPTTHLEIWYNHRITYLLPKMTRGISSSSMSTLHHRHWGMMQPVWSNSLAFQEKTLTVCICEGLLPILDVHLQPAIFTFLHFFIYDCS